MERDQLKYVILGVLIPVCCLNEIYESRESKIINICPGLC